MIDWSKVGPGNTPTPQTPTTTTPVVSQPEPTGTDPFAGIGTVGPTKAYEFGTGFHEATQQQIDSMDPGQRIGRGIDNLGNALFGRDNGSLLGGVPLLGDIVGAAGNVGHLGGSLVLKPFEAAAAGAARVPLGWLPGGADEGFNQIGEWAKVNNPEIYQQWQLVNADANSDVLYGGNLKADFNMEVAKLLDDQQYNSTLGINPDLAMGREGIGSLGGAFTHAVTGFLGLFGNTSQRFLGEHGIFDPGTSSATYEQQKDRFFNGGGLGVNDEQRKAFEMLRDGQINEDAARIIVVHASQGGRNRVQEAADRMELGLEVSDTEKQAVEAWKSGEWSLDHAMDFLVQRGQGITRNTVGQIAGSVVTDPLTYATIGAGAIAKTGLKGAAVGEAALGSGYKGLSLGEKLAFAAQQESNYNKIATTVAAVQADPMLGPISRVARGMIDPLATYKPGTVQRSVTNLLDNVAISAYSRAYGYPTIQAMRGIAREFGLTREIDGAIASYVKDQARLMIARKVARDTVDEALGAVDQRAEQLVKANVDEVIDPMVKNAPRDAVTKLVDHFMTTMKNTFGPEEEATLAGRMAATFGHDIPYWEKRIGTMSNDLKSALHSVTYKRAEVGYTEALAKVDQVAYDGKAPLRNMVLMTTDTLDEEVAAAVIKRIEKVLAGEESDPKKIAAATKYWNDMARRYPKIGSIGHAPGGKEQLELLNKELKRLLDNGAITKRFAENELAHPALRPVRDWLDTQVGKDGKRLWNLGFRPDEDVAWGLRRNPITGDWIVDTDPTISHVIDATPGRQPFSDTTRNVLGQMIGPSKAERLNKPIESIEAYANSMRDVITGQRLVKNIEMRFERSMYDAGVPMPIIRDIFGKARDVAGLDYTTVRGIRPDNLWEAVHDLVPRNLLLKDGSTLNVHIIMDHLLKAAEGDLRVMGVSSVLSQRMRNALRAAGADPANWAGYMTVTMYNKLRYMQPMFLIQRIGDAPYYSILYGITPVGKTLTGPQQALKLIADNLARTGLGRDFSMDMVEYATRSNFTQGIKSAMQQAGLVSNKLDKIIRAPDAIIAANMTNMMSHRLGDMVRGALDNLATAAEKDPALKAEMLAEGERLTNSFEDWRKVYSASAGRVLSDDEVGLRYMQDTLNGWRRHVVRADGTVDMSGLIHEGEMFMPDDIAGIESINPHWLSRELGFPDEETMRKAITGEAKRINGEYVHLRGEHDLAWLEEQLRHTLHMNDDQVKRSMAYFSDDWEGFWRHVGRPIEEGGLDITPHFAAEAQTLIAAIAHDRGMNPWEYLSGAMTKNIGPQDLGTAMGRFMAFLKGGPIDGTPEEWGQFFRAHLDPSAQQTLMDEWARMTAAAAPAPEPAAAAAAPEAAAAAAPEPPPIDLNAEYPDMTRIEVPDPTGAGAPTVSYSKGARFYTPEEAAAAHAPTGVEGTIETKMAAGDVAGSQADNVAEGVARGGTAESGGAMLPEKPFRQVPGADPGVQFVPIERLKPFIEIDRNVVPKALPDSPLADLATDVQGLADDIAKNGFDPKQPVTLSYDEHTGTALLSDGNHRLAAAERAGLTEIPVQVKPATRFASEADLTVPPKDFKPVETKPTGHAATQASDLFKMEEAAPTAPPVDPVQDFFEKGIVDMLKHRVRTGPNPNPDVEAILQQISKMVQKTLKGTPEAGNTRTQLRRLVREAGGETGPLPEEKVAAEAAVAGEAAAPAAPLPAKEAVKSFPLDVSGTPYRVTTRPSANGNRFHYDIAIQDGTLASGAPKFRHVSVSGETFETADDAEKAGAEFARGLHTQSVDATTARRAAEAEAEAAAKEAERVAAERAAADAAAASEVAGPKVNVVNAEQGKTGYRYEINGRRSDITYVSEDAARAAGERDAAAQAAKVKADLAAPRETADEELARLKDNMDISARQAAKDPPSIGAAKVDTFYDRSNKNYVTRLVDEDGNQVGDAITDGTKADRDAAVREMTNRLVADKAQQQLEADAAKDAAKYAEAQAQRTFEQMVEQRAAQRAADAVAREEGPITTSYDLTTDDYFAYDAGWAASKRSKTIDLDAAEARYEAKHPGYKGTMFAAGWGDEASDAPKGATLRRYEENAAAERATIQAQRDAARAAAAEKQTSEDILQQAEQDANDAKDNFLTKWEDSDRPSHGSQRKAIEKDLDKLDAAGWDTSEARDHLSNYDGMDRSEFKAEEYGSREDATEAYNDARQEEWTGIWERIKEQEYETPQSVQDAADQADQAFEQLPEVGAVTPEAAAAPEPTTYYHGTTKGNAEAIRREGFSAEHFGARDRGPLAEPDYKGVYLTTDKKKATEYYSTSADRPTNDVLGGGDVVEVNIDESRLAPLDKWKGYKRQASINMMDDNGDLPAGGVGSQEVLDETVRLAQADGYIGVRMRAGEETLIFDPKDARPLAPAAPPVNDNAEYVGLNRVEVPPYETGAESVIRYYEPISHRWLTPEEAAAGHTVIPPTKVTASEAPELASKEAYYGAGNLDLKNRDASVKAFDALPDDASVWVFHATDKETADRLAAEGIDMANTPENLARVRYAAGEDATFAPGAGVGQGMYVGGTAYGVEGYGREMIAIRVPKGSLKIAPESEGSALSLGDALINHDGALLTESIGPENVVRIPRSGKVPGDSYDEISRSIGGGGGGSVPPEAPGSAGFPEDLPPEPTAAEDLAGVRMMPTNLAAPFNRSQALIVSLLKDKIEDAGQDVFRLAEMQTQRTALERSLNHPLFGLYPASYMWGKVLPETTKFLAKNPYAATYTIHNVQNSIAIQREYDRDLEDKISAVDRSAGAFLIDYLTPGLPWSDHSARMSPLVRDIFAGKDVGQIWSDELATVSPQRWVSQVVETMNEVPGAVDAITQPPGNAQPLPNLLPGVNPVQGQITGPVSGSALAPLMMSDLERLQSILLKGESPEE